MSAALAASDQGIDSIIFEQDAMATGSTAMSYGAICAAGSAIQLRAGIEDSASDLFEDILAITQGKTDPELALLLAERSGPTVDWLHDTHNIELTTEQSWTGLGHRQPRLHAPEDRSGKTLMQSLLAACERAACMIVTQARITRLYVNHDDHVLGVAITRPDGACEEIGCDTLILATCGYAGNPDLVKRYMPELADAQYFGHEGNRGDAVLWGEALGAQVDDMGAYQALGSLADPQRLVIPHTLLIGGGIQVNTQGIRFENELDDISGQALTILAQPGGCCWIVYDEKRHEKAIARFEEYRSAVSIGTPKIAETVAQLSTLTAIPEDALSETLKATRQLCCNSATDAFGRSFQSEHTLEPPYYAIRVTGALFHSQGGLCVDSEARVKKTSVGTFPNLFAGGGAVRSVSGPGGWGYLPGMGLCTAVTLGSLAGECAARQVQPGD